MEYLDITKPSSNIELTNAKHITSTGYTMGFWFLATDKDLSTNVFRVMYEENMMITVTTDTDLYGHCFIGLEYYDIVGKTNTAANTKSFYEGLDVGNVNMKKTVASCLLMILGVLVKQCFCFLADVELDFRYKVIMLTNCPKSKFQHAKNVI